MMRVKISDLVDAFNQWAAQLTTTIEASDRVSIDVNVSQVPALIMTLIIKILCQLSLYSVKPVVGFSDYKNWRRKKVHKSSKYKS